MPLYDLVLMVKKGVEKRSVVELLANLGQRVYTSRGVVTNVKSFGRVNLAYAIKKRDGRHNEEVPRASFPIQDVIKSSGRMALLMEPGVEPMTEEEKADFEAMAAIREEAALELKEEGNEFLKKGRKVGEES